MPLYYPLYVSTPTASAPTWTSYTQPAVWPQSTAGTMPTSQQIYRWYVQAAQRMPTVWVNPNATAPTLIAPQTVAWYSSEWYDDIEPPNRFVPYTPAIIRRLGDRHEREELARADRATQEAALQAEVARRFAQQAANDRARELLLAHLTDEQRETFEKNNWFVVEGGKSKQQYRIHVGRGYSANIEVVGMNHRLCAHLASNIPFADQILAQKVSLELDEEHFVRTANVHPGRGYL